jgi:hypothetical protein
MSDSSIPSDLVDQNTIKLRHVEERKQARLQAQSEWRISNTLLCDCRSCIKARELRSGDARESARPRPPAVVAQHGQPDISQQTIPYIRSLFGFLLRDI